MKFFLASVRTFAYWRYALFSWEAFGKVLAVAALLYFLVEMLDFFRVYTRDKYSGLAVPIILVVSAIIVVIRRRPITKVAYKLPKKDITIEVKIGDLLNEAAAVAISSSRTFDTDPALISPNSLQGQVALTYFQGNTGEIDKQIQLQLKGQKSKTISRKNGKTKQYPIGTVAKITAQGKTFYLFAMSEFNDEGNAFSTVQMIDDALAGLWSYVRSQGELGSLAVPVVGTGRGRIQLPRKKIIERIAQSFADASSDAILANRLTIVIHPSDAENFQVNLFQIRDYLSQSLHV